MMGASSTKFTSEVSPFLEVQSWVYSVNKKGLSTQPWGPPVLCTRVVELWQSVLSGVCLWGSQIFSIRVLSCPKTFMIQIRLCWMVRWYQQIACWWRWHFQGAWRLCGRVVDMASSVDLMVLNAYLWWCGLAGRLSTLSKLVPTKESISPSLTGVLFSVILDPGPPNKCNRLIGEQGHCKDVGTLI